MNTFIAIIFIFFGLVNMIAFLSMLCKYAENISLKQVIKKSEDKIGYFFVMLFFSVIFNQWTLYLMAALVPNAIISALFYGSVRSRKSREAHIIILTLLASGFLSMAIHFHLKGFHLF